MYKVAIAIIMSFCIFSVQAQPMEDCVNMANRWSDIFTSAPAIETMTELFMPNALVFGTVSKELGATASDVAAYFTPVYARKIRIKNVIKSQRAIKISDNVWVIAGLYDFSSLSDDGAQTVTPARFHFVVVREGSQCKIAAFNSSRVPN